MRYKCRSCERVFHLDAGEAAPCPYCGGVLGKEQGLFDEGSGTGPGESPGAGPAPSAGAGAGAGETFFASSEDLDIGGWPSVKPGEQGPQEQGPQEQGPQEQSAPTAPGSYERGGPPGILAGVPSPTSMITPEAGPSASPDSYLTQPSPWSAAPGNGDEVAAPPDLGPGGEPTQTDTSQLDRMARTAPNLFRGAPPPARPVTRPPVVRAPLGGRTAVVAIVAAVLGLAAGAGAMLLWLPRRSSQAEKEKVARAERKADELDKALKVLKGQRGELLAEKQALVARLEEMPAQETAQERAQPQGPPTYSKALDLTLDALKLLERRADIDRALETAEAAVKAEPALASAHRMKGRVLAALGRAGPALAAFEAANEAAKQAGKEAGKEGGTPGTGSTAGDAEALVLAGEVCLTHLTDRERAAGYYADAAEIGAGSALGLVAKARAHQIAENLKGAVREAQRAAKADPTLALAPLVTGEILLELALGRKGSPRERTLEKAGHFLAEAVRLDPNSARACLMRGRMLVEASSLKKFGLARYERQDEAARLLQRAKDLSPGLAGAYRALAELRLDSGALRDPAAAVKLAQGAVDLTERKDVDALVTLAAARAATGDPRAAASAVEEALRLAPMNGELRPVLEKYRSEAQAIGR